MAQTTPKTDPEKLAEATALMVAGAELEKERVVRPHRRQRTC